MELLQDLAATAAGFCAGSVFGFAFAKSYYHQHHKGTR